MGVLKPTDFVNTLTGSGLPFETYLRIVVCKEVIIFFKREPLKILLIVELLFKSLGIYAAFKVFSLLSISIIASPHLKYYVLVYHVLFVLFQMKLKKRRYVFKIYFSFGKQYCCSIYHFRNSLMFF